MLWSRSMFCLLVTLLSFAAGAANKPVNTPEIDQKICADLIGLSIVSAEPGQAAQLDRSQGFGKRGFLSSYPGPMDPAGKELSAQGMYYWGHSFAIRKTLEEAREHDVKAHGLSKLMYFITDIDVSDLSDQTPLDIVQERFRQILDTGRMVYWDDSEAMITAVWNPAKKDFDLDPEIEDVLVEVDKATAKRYLTPEMISFSDPDKYGARFGQSGWVFPRIRGELNYDYVFNSGSKTTKKVMKEGNSLLAKGYTIGVNMNFREALDMARDMKRAIKDPVTGKFSLQPNSRYFTDPNLYAKTWADYEAGRGFSAEMRDPSGRLVAGILGERDGNIIKLDTTYYDMAVSEDGLHLVSEINSVKFVVMETLRTMNVAGVPMADAGMVTEFTAGVKGRYFWGTDFAKHLDAFRDLPPIELNLGQPAK